MIWLQYITSQLQVGCKVGRNIVCKDRLSPVFAHKLIATTYHLWSFATFAICERPGLGFYEPSSLALYCSVYVQCSCVMAVVLNRLQVNAWNTLYIFMATLLGEAN